MPYVLIAGDYMPWTAGNECAIRDNNGRRGSPPERIFKRAKVVDFVDQNDRINDIS